MYSAIRNSLFFGIILASLGLAHADIRPIRPPWQPQLDPIQACIISCNITENRCIDDAMKYSILACPLGTAAGLCLDPVMSAVVYAMVAKCEDDGFDCRNNCWTLVGPPRGFIPRINPEN